MESEDKLLSRLVHTMVVPQPPPEPQEPMRHPLAGRTAGVRSTSRKTFKQINGQISDKQRQVYVALQMSDRPVCNQELAAALKWPINEITPRVNELVGMGKVGEAYRAVYNKTGRRVIHWQPCKKQRNGDNV